MSLRTGHGKGKGSPRIEVLPANELPAGVAVTERNPGAAVRRDAQGRLADAQSARELGRKGGLAKAGQTRLGSSLALGGAFADPRFEPYAKAAKAFRCAQVHRLATTVGGGECGPAPASMVASAALQLAASRFAFEVLGDMQLGSRLANDSRQNLLGAHELAAKEAQARPKKPSDTPWLTGGTSS
jgi:hypothetical protein